ncbi:ABC transporter permease [Planococcus lenghuensis]|uniref:Sugar ABC transporter permease n=1 Tax=Planococcus lenghuensis TaxID=2213202 RepID=A0A1Q2KZW2_9BACL|nr:ABC transporter permease [Planococcus lenghuensis]AQQ53703.1 sugar ABC transporter permease [Planococcus lenghuensis]
MSPLEIFYFLVSSAIFYAAPLIIVAIGGVFSERSGVVNIGLEGLMVIGAFTGIVFNLFFVDALGEFTPWVSLIIAMITGTLFSLLLAIAAVSFRADQVVTGVAINLLAIAVAIFLVKLIFQKGQTDIISVNFSQIRISFLRDIPIIGDMYWTSLLAIAIAFISWAVIYYTPFGLRLRAVGEHPAAADTMGVNVTKMRYVAVMISGALGGLGGAIYAQTISNDFGHATITGQGFMALAAMIFGKWHPLGAMGAALFFGFAQSLSIVGPSLPFFSEIPTVFLYILPYVLTILALAGFIGRASAPKASGTPYIKGNR